MAVRFRDRPEAESWRPPRSGRASGLALFLGAAAVGFALSLLSRSLFRRGEEDLRVRPPGPSSSVPSSSADAPPRIVPRFVDVAEAAGIRYRHEAGSRGKFYYPEVMGAGCAFLDYDSDGDLDVYLVNGNLLLPEAPDPAITNVLYRNDGRGTFTDVTEGAGVGDSSYGQGCASGDYDSDGDEDIYVTNYGPNVLYRNLGDGTFEKVDGILSDGGWGQASAFFDADGDGDLDLYAQNYLDYDVARAEPWYAPLGGEKILDYCSPSGYRGQQDRLFRNLGDGTFADATVESGIVVPEGTGMGLVCADLDDDGDMDIVVSNDSRPNFFFRNDGKGRFTESALIAGLAYNAEGGREAFMGVDAGDYDGDGRTDLAIPSLRSEGFNLYRNTGGSFLDVSIPTGVEAATSGVTGFAPVFLDYDSDGDLDLFFTAGEVRMGRTEARAGSSFQERYAMRSVLLENRQGKFVNVSAHAGPFFENLCVGRACSAGDFDDDGDTDLLVTTMGGPAVLLRNDTEGGSWIGFRLVGTPANRDAVGARLWLQVAGKALVREVAAGGSYLGQRDRRVLFGLGGAGGVGGPETVGRLRIRWPDGKETTHEGLEPGRYHVIRRGN